MMVEPGVYIFERGLVDPAGYRTAALAKPFAQFGEFRGISPATFEEGPPFVAKQFLGLEPTLSFFRKSPQGQPEPNFIHTDVDMGTWTAILYLNPTPDPQDGTDFWT